MNKLTHYLSRYLKPSQITLVYIVAAFLLIVLFVSIVADARTPDKKAAPKKSDITNIITSKNTRGFGLDAVNDKATTTAKSLHKLETQFDKMKGTVASNQKDVRSSQQLARELKRTQDELEQVKRQNLQQTAMIEERVKKAVEYQMNELRVEGIITGQPVGNQNKPLGKVDPQRRPTRNTNFSYGNTNNQGATTAVVPSVRSTTSSESSVKNTNEYAIPEQRTVELFTVVEEEHSEIADDSDEIYLPKGAILSGVLITGFDAPTQSSASDNPMPVLVRVKKEAILPNHFVLEEVRECFALLAGYGDLSSERAHLRGEAITCVKENGEVLEKDFGSYAVGEDGKAGLKGTLVTRNSAILVRTMMAGFMSGMASAFDVTPVPVISTSSDGTQQYQDVWSQDAVQGGVAKGASEGLDKLAEYYMDLADQMHPVIEIGGGRVIDMIITKGTAL